MRRTGRRRASARFGSRTRRRRLCSASTLYEQGDGRRARWRTAVRWSCDRLRVRAAVDCGGSVLRFDPSSNRAIARISALAESDEGLIAAGEGGVWTLSSHNADHDYLLRIDPATNKVADRVLVPRGRPRQRSASALSG